MSDPNRDLEKKLINYLENKQYDRLQFEIEMMGDIETQENSLLVFYYASSIFLKENSKEKELIFASNLLEKVYRKQNNHLKSLYNMIAIGLKTRIFKDIIVLAEEIKKNEKTILVNGLTRINMYLTKS